MTNPMTARQSPRNGPCRHPGRVILIRNGPFHGKVIHVLRIVKLRRHFPTPPLMCNEVRRSFHNFTELRDNVEWWTGLAKRREGTRVGGSTRKTASLSTNANYRNGCRLARETKGQKRFFSYLPRPNDARHDAHYPPDAPMLSINARGTKRLSYRREFDAWARREDSPRHVTRRGGGGRNLPDAFAPTWLYRTLWCRPELLTPRCETRLSRFCSRACLLLFFRSTIETAPGNSSLTEGLIK